MRSIPRLQMVALAAIATLTLFLATGCSSMKAPARGTLIVSVHNDGIDLVDDVLVMHGNQEMEAPMLAPGTSQETQFFFDPDSVIEVRYVFRGERKRASLPVHALENHSGIIQLRIDRDGQLRPVERFFVR